MNNSRIVILLTPEFMYFQRPHTDIKDQAHIVEIFVPEASFPAKLGFIELPYSQGPSFFTNLALYHEIGHFVYEELTNAAPPYPAMAALRGAVNRSLNRALSKRPRDPEAFAIASKIFEDWIQEIFCDLFALRLVGPAFSFAFVEMLGMLGFLSETATRFNPSHPAPACRFSEHVHMLRHDLWWDAIADLRADQKKQLETLAKLPRSSYTFFIDEKTRGPQKLVDGFLDDVVPAIRKLVLQVTPKNPAAVNRFKKARPIVEDCLRAGVVPHSIDPAALDPVSVINATFCFYLTSLPDVVRQFEGPESEYDVAAYSRWTRRLEMWTMKAIEDAQMQNRLKRTKGGPLWSSLEKKS
jgi:hypothetical protein